MKQNKRQRGQYYTVTNPFAHKAFRHWAKCANLPDNTVLEPFAGCNSLINHLYKMGLCQNYESFDIEPTNSKVHKRNTLNKFPKGFNVCVTNPPWLARNSASGRGLAFPDTPYDDLYKHSLEKCLDNCDYLAALVPESFIRSGLFRDRLNTFISLTKPIFYDTTHPVGLAMFLPEITNNTMIYSGHKRVGILADIEKSRPVQTLERKIKFNSPNGNIGLIAVDNTQGASIRFCHPKELENYNVRAECRYITRLDVNGYKPNIEQLNKILNKFRETTSDVLMTPYRGLRKDGKYRRRLDWGLARGLICAG